MRWGLVGVLVAAGFGLYELVRWLGWLALGLGGALIMLFVGIVVLSLAAKREAGL